MSDEERRAHTDAAVDAILGVARDGCDVAEWVAVVLCTAAAELGSSYALVARRSGSWEAAGVLQLVHGTAGPADEYLHGYHR